MWFRKKPVLVEAMQFRADTGQALVDWLESHSAKFEMYSDFSGLHIDTLEGEMAVHPSDWVIRGVRGEFYPCKPDIFEETYKVEEA